MTGAPARTGDDHRMRLRLASTRPHELHAWTGLSGPALRTLIDRLWQARPDRGRGRRWVLGFADRVLLVALAWRTNLTERQLAALFGISQSSTHRVVADLAPHLAKLLGDPPADRRYLWVIDGTLIPVHDHARTAKSKNYRRSVNVQVVAHAKDRTVLAVGDAWPGNRNDVVVFRETLAGKHPDHPRLKGDGGYRGAPTVTSPTRGPDGRIVKDAAYRRSARRRAVAEHTLARLKDRQVLRQHRRRGDAIDHTTRGVAALHNLRIEIG